MKQNMRTGAYKWIAGVLLSGVVLTSCQQNNYYNTQPNNNHHNTGYQSEFYDNFSSDKYNWGFGSPSDSAYASVQNGELLFVNYALGGLQTAVVSTGANFNGDFLVSASVKSDNRMGIVFGASSSDYGYSFIIDNNGQFEVYKEGSATVAATQILGWTSSTAITSNGWNTLKVEQVSNSWTGYINGVQVFQISAYSTAGSRCGFILLPNTAGHGDDLDVKW